MKPLRKTAMFSGILFLTAMATSLVGGGLLEMVLGSADLQSAVATKKGLAITGIILEIINAASVAGIGILLFSIMKIRNEQTATGYISFRILEMFCCFAAAVLPLLLIQTDSKEISQETIDFLLKSRSQITHIFIPLFFCLGALILYTFLYKTKLVPRYISVWGFTGVAGIAVLNIVNIQNNVGMLLALPIILNEIFLGIWLIAKGFNTENLK